jgi:CheY-like chemotaxis protein
LNMKRLLVVDDEPVVRALITACLDGAGWEVDAVADGAAALDAASQTQPDLILLDVGLPGLSGPAVLQQLRAAPPTASIPILYLTGLEPLDGPRADGVVAKPFTPAALRATLSAWLEEGNRQPPTCNQA